MDSSEEDTADVANGAVFEEDEEDGIDAVEDGEDEDEDEEVELERRPMSSPLSHWEEILDLDSMADNATTLAETMNTLHTTGHEPRVELRCRI